MNKITKIAAACILLAIGWMLCYVGNLIEHLVTGVFFLDYKRFANVVPDKPKCPHLCVRCIEMEEADEHDHWAERKDNAI